MNERLTALKQELEKGHQQMALLDRRRQELRDTLLRIAGAIQVLEELQAQPETPSPESLSPALSPAA